MGVELKGPSFPFAGFMLADRRVVLLVVSRDLVTDAVNHMIEDALARVESALGGADQARMLLQQGPGVARILVWANGPDGDRQAWDVAVPLPAGGADQDEDPAAGGHTWDEAHVGLVIPTCNGPDTPAPSRGVP